MILLTLQLVDNDGSYQFVITDHENNDKTDTVDLDDNTAAQLPMYVDMLRSMMT